MNAAMDPDHPQAGRALQLHALATTAMRNIASLNLSLSPELQDLVALYGIDNDGAMEALRTTLPDAKRHHAEICSCRDDARRARAARWTVRRSGCSVRNGTSITSISAKKPTRRCTVLPRPARAFKAAPPKHVDDLPDEHQPVRLSATAVPDDVERLRVRRAVQQGDEQHQRRPAHRVEGKAAAVRRRRGVGHEVQGGQGERRMERDVA